LKVNPPNWYCEFYATKGHRLYHHRAAFRKTLKSLILTAYTKQQAILAARKRYPNYSPTCHLLVRRARKADYL